MTNSELLSDLEPICTKWLVYQFLYQDDFSAPPSGARGTCPRAPLATPLHMQPKYCINITANLIWYRNYQLHSFYAFE